MRVRAFAFVPGLLALALVAVGRSSTALLQLSAASWVPLWLLLRGTSGTGRALVGEGLGLLGLAVAVLFYTSQGDPVPFRLSVVLAVWLVVSTVAHTWAVERERPVASASAATVRVGPAVLTPANALAFLVVMHAVLLGLAVSSFPLHAAGYAWLLGGATFLGLAPLALLCVPRGRWGRLLSIPALAALELAFVWHAASIEVAMEQGRPLPWDEVAVRLAEPGGWRVLVEGIVSLRFVLVTLGLLGGYGLLARRLGRLSGATSLLATTRLVASVAVFGGLLLSQPLLVDPDLALGYREATAAPWSAVHRRTMESRPFDARAAARLRARVAPPQWADGPAEPLASLAGRYPRRSIVVVLMESQAARLMAGLGEGAYGFSPAQPELARLVPSGVLFTNYFAAGFPTATALWTVVTGLPLPAGSAPAVQWAPEAARVGRLPDFAALGYGSDWLCPASPRFDNWDRLMTEAGARWWLENDEVHGLDRTHWTAWGMPDEQLYAVALRRYLSAPHRGTGFLMGLLTVSNHRPYRLPPGADGIALPADHVGGTRYADRAVGAFVDALRALPEAERPIVFLTADTAQIEGLREHTPLGIYSPEGARIPGLLLLPDGAAAGRPFEGVFCHEDLLDLLYALVAPPGASAGPKFVERYRVVTVGFGGLLAASADAYCVEVPPGCWAIEGRWRLRPLANPGESRRLELARSQFAADEGAVWPAEAPAL